MDENGSRPSMARPLLCGIMMALVVLAIGLAAWTLVGIDRRSQQLARSDDAMVGQCPDDSGDGHSWSLGTQPLYSRQLHFTMKAVALNGRLQEKRFEQVKEK